MFKKLTYLENELQNKEISLTIPIFQHDTFTVDLIDFYNIYTLYV